MHLSHLVTGLSLFILGAPIAVSAEGDAAQEPGFNVEEIMAADSNGDGVITRDEFRSFMHSRRGDGQGRRAAGDRDGDSPRGQRRGDGDEGPRGQRGQRRHDGEGPHGQRRGDGDGPRGERRRDGDGPPPWAGRGRDDEGPRGQRRHDGEGPHGQRRGDSRGPHGDRGSCDGKGPCQAGEGRGRQAQDRAPAELEQRLQRIERELRVIRALLETR